MPLDDTTTLITARCTDQKRARQAHRFQVADFETEQFLSRQPRSTVRDMVHKAVRQSPRMSIHQEMLNALSIANIKRIIRDYRARGLLIADHVRIAGFDSVSHEITFPQEMTVGKTTYYTPHGCIDHSLGVRREDSCPCTFPGEMRSYLFRLEYLHKRIVLCADKARAKAIKQFEDCLRE